MAGLKATIICMAFGALVGSISVTPAGMLGFFGGLAAPVAVGIGAAVLVLAAHIRLLGTIPASVYGFASVAGLILVGAKAPFEALLPTILSIVSGAAFGFASEALAGKLTKPAAN